VSPNSITVLLKKKQYTQKINYHWNLSFLTTFYPMNKSYYSFICLSVFVPIYFFLSAPLVSNSEQQKTKTKNLQRDQITTLIEKAINLGVPLYNSGSHSACRDIYNITLQAISGFTEGIVSQNLIANAITETELRDPKNGAWLLRHILDEIYFAVKEGTSIKDNKIVFDFSGQSPFEWFSVNDNVMGGISKGQVERTKQDTMKFLGRLSLKNNGGFSSVRSQIPDFTLAGYDGLMLKIRGDDRYYSVLVTTLERGRTWQTKFKTSTKWQIVKVPFKKMQMSVMGWRPNVSPKITGNRIRAIGFIIADKNETPFTLEVDWIKAYID